MIAAVHTRIALATLGLLACARVRMGAVIGNRGPERPARHYRPERAVDAITRMLAARDARPEFPHTSPRPIALAPRDT